MRPDAARRSDFVAGSDRRDESVTLRLTRLKVGTAIAPDTKRPAQGGDLKLISFVDAGTGLDARDHLLLAGKFARPLDERNQDFQRATAKTHRRLAFEQEPPARKQAEGTERQRALGTVRIGHGKSPKLSGVLTGII
jgi:hypothetical protein